MTKGYKILLDCLGEGILKIGLSPSTLILGAGSTSVIGTIALKKEYPKDMLGSSILGTGLSVAQLGSTEFQEGMNRLGLTQEYIESLDEEELSELIEKLKRKEEELKGETNEAKTQEVPKEKVRK